MNILNVPEDEIQKVYNQYKDDDSLEFFLKIGKDYMKKYGTEVVDINSLRGQEEIRRILFACFEEIGEFANTLKNKKWCVSEYPVDEQHMWEELADVFAFFVQLLLALNLDKEKFKRIYVSKLVINQFRLDSQY